MLFDIVDICLVSIPDASTVKVPCVVSFSPSISFTENSYSNVFSSPAPNLSNSNSNFSTDSSSSIYVLYGMPFVTPNASTFFSTKNIAFVCLAVNLKFSISSSELFFTVTSYLIVCPSFTVSPSFNSFNADIALTSNFTPSLTL